MGEMLQHPEWVMFLVLENLILLNLIIWFFFFQMIRNRENKPDYEILEMLNQYYEQNMYDVKQRYDQISMIKHDMRNTLLVVENLMREKRLSEAESFLNEQVERIDSIYQIVKTDNNFVNAILNQKLSEARDKGIEVRCAVLTSFQGIENRDLCSLFGNLLDNAIEANEGIKGSRYLELVLEGDADELEVICRNSTEGEVNVTRNRLPRTKKDRRWHGYGTRIMREIAEKYKGELVYRSEEKELEATVRLVRRKDDDVQE